jgi:hypothetical protein
MKTITTILAFATIALFGGAMATWAKGPDLPNYPIRNEIDRDAYDTLATYWGDDVPADQCALDRIKARHITKTYLNLLNTFNACQSKEIEENDK